MAAGVYPLRSEVEAAGVVVGPLRVVTDPTGSAHMVFELKETVHMKSGVLEPAFYFIDCDGRLYLPELKEHGDRGKTVLLSPVTCDGSTAMGFLDIFTALATGGDLTRDGRKSLRDGMESLGCALPPAYYQSVGRCEKLMIPTAATFRLLAKEELYSYGAVSDQKGGVTLLIPNHNGGLRAIEPLDEYDKNLVCYVASLYEAGFEVVTPSDILHMDGVKKPNAKQVDKLKRRLERLASTRITFDCSDMAQKYGCGRAKATRNAINIETVEAGLRNGRIGTAYRIIELPASYWFARECGGMVATVPAGLMGLGGRTNAKRSVIKRTILERVYSKKLSPCVRYWPSKRRSDTQSLFQIAGVERASRDESARMRAFTKGYLDALRGAGSIESWEEYEDGGKPAGVRFKRAGPGANG